MVGPPLGVISGVAVSRRTVVYHEEHCYKNWTSNIILL